MTSSFSNPKKPATGDRRPATGDDVRRADPVRSAHRVDLEQATGNRRPATGDVSRPEDLQRGADIALRTLALASEVLKLTRIVKKDFAGKHACTQLIRSVTSAGANYEEARAAESRSDFIHKLSIAAKETRETIYWLRLLETAGMTTSVDELVFRAVELCAILGKSIKTARESPGRASRVPRAL